MAVDTEPVAATDKKTLSSTIAPSTEAGDEQGDGLTASQLETWHRDGYLIIPDAISPGDVQQLLKESRRMLEEDLVLEDHPMTKFSTGDEKGEEHVGDDYFLTSGDKIRFFFEEGAFDKSGNLTKPKEAAINKIGHSLHTLSPPFRDLSLSARNAGIARSLGFHSPKVLQSMIICKQPEIGGAVPPHQDSTFLFTDPPSAVGFWYALEDATEKNGTLSFLPGSHRWARIEKRFVRRSPDGLDGTTFIELDGEKGDSVFPRGLETVPEPTGERDSSKYDLRTVKAGTLVLIHGNLLHKSEANRSDKSRFIYTFHMIEGSESNGGWRYDERNWLQPTGAGFSDLYSAPGL